MPEANANTEVLNGKRGLSDVRPTAFHDMATQFLGAFVKLRKATDCFVMFVCLDSNWTHFDEI